MRRITLALATFAVFAIVPAASADTTVPVSGGERRRRVRLRANRHD